MKHLVLGSGLSVLMVLLVHSSAPLQAAETVVYKQDFQQVDIGAEPEDFLVLDGWFEVKEVDGNKVFQLPGAPLDSFGFLFGPAQKDGVSLTGRIFSEGRGRRYPAFGVGLNGVSGYRLMVAPAKRAIELYQGDAVVASREFRWKSGAWTHFHLQVRAVDGGWRVEGKVWQEGATAPTDWTVVHEQKEEPIPGRPAAWGKPFSGKPILFDDLILQKLPAS